MLFSSFLSAPSFPRPGLADPGEAADRPRRVLIVEDDTTARIAGGFLFRRLGLETATAATLHEGFDRLAWNPDWILLDLMLPDGNGIELLRLVRRVGLPVRVVVATGCYDWHLLEAVKALRPEHVLLKPLDWDVVGRWFNDRPNPPTELGK